jgi:hypothetical protein
VNAEPSRAYGRNFGRIPDELLWDKQVSDGACRLYAALTRYSQRGDRIVPERKELAERLGWSTSKLDRYREELERLGALHVEHRFDPKGGRQVASAYWIDGRRPLPKSDKGAAVDPLPKSDKGDLPKSGKGFHIEKKRASPNGDGTSRKRDGRADTLVGKCVEAMGGRPVEAQAFAGIVDKASKAGMSGDLIAKVCREWWHAGEPVSFLTGRLGQAQRKAAAEPAVPSYAHDPTARLGHDPADCGLCIANRKDAAAPPAEVA